MRLAIGCVDALHDGQAERGRLAGAGARLHEQVATFADRREDGVLNFGWNEVAEVIERLLNVGVEVQRCERAERRRVDDDVGNYGNDRRDSGE